MVFLIARTDYVRGLNLDAMTSEREVVKASFQLGTVRYRLASTQRHSLLFRHLHQQQLRDWVPKQMAWDNIG